MEIGENNCASHFYVIYTNYVIVSCPQTQGTIIDVHIENCTFISVIVFILYFRFFYWGRAKYNNFFHFLALYMLVSVSKF